MFAVNQIVIIDANHIVFWDPLFRSVHWTGSLGWRRSRAHRADHWNDIVQAGFPLSDLPRCLDLVYQHHVSLQHLKHFWVVSDFPTLSRAKVIFNKKLWFNGQTKLPVSCNEDIVSFLGNSCYLFDVEGLVTVIAFEGSDTLMKQHVTFKSHLFSEPLSTLVYRTRMFKG